MRVTERERKRERVCWKNEKGMHDGNGVEPRALSENLKWTEMNSGIEKNENGNLLTRLASLYICNN